MVLTRTIEPAAEPVDRTEAKLHLHVTADSEDGLIDSMIAAARDYLENAIGRQMVSAGYELRLDRFPQIIEIPMPPLQAVSTIKYYDLDGVLRTVDRDTYSVDIYGEPGKVDLLPGSYWPATQRVPNAVLVTFTAGYGDAADVPAGLKMAMMWLINHWYVHRESVLTGTISKEIEHQLEAMLSRFWIGRAYPCNQAI